jgi:hypothetical protein
MTIFKALENLTITVLVSRIFFDVIELIFSMYFRVLTLVFLKQLIYLPRSNSPARKRPVPDNSGDFIEAVFRSENFRIFSNAFRPVPAGNHRKLVGIHRKKSEKCPAGILLSKNHQNYPELAVFGPDCSTWEVFREIKLILANYIMRKKVVGQDNAINSVDKAVLRHRCELSRQNQPIGFFLFLGNFI